MPRAEPTRSKPLWSVWVASSSVVGSGQRISASKQTLCASPSPRRTFVVMLALGTLTRPASLLRTSASSKVSKSASNSKETSSLGICEMAAGVDSSAAVADLASHRA